MARLQWEKECERDFQLRRELEIRKLDADTAFRMRQLELQTGSVGSSSGTQPLSGSDAPFDVGNHIQLVPVFCEFEVESYFVVFERIAAASQWPKDVWAILLQCELVGKAQMVCSSLPVEDSIVYTKKLNALLKCMSLCLRLIDSVFVA